MAETLTIDKHPKVTGVTSFPEPVPTGTELGGPEFDVTYQTDSSTYVGAEIIDVYAYASESDAWNDNNGVLVGSTQAEYTPENSQTTQTIQLWDTPVIPESYAEDGQVYFTLWHSDYSRPFGIIQAVSEIPTSAVDLAVKSPEIQSDTAGKVTTSVIAYADSDDGTATASGQIEVTVGGQTQTKTSTEVGEKLLEFTFTNVASGSTAASYNSVDNDSGNGEAKTGTVDVSHENNNLNLGSSTAYVNSNGDVEATVNVTNEATFSIEADVKFMADGKSTTVKQELGGGQTEGLNAVIGQAPTGSFDVTYSILNTSKSKTETVDNTSDGGTSDGDTTDGTDGGTSDGTETGNAPVEAVDVTTSKNADGSVNVEGKGKSKTDVSEFVDDRFRLLQNGEVKAENVGFAEFTVDGSTDKRTFFELSAGDYTPVFQILDLDGNVSSSVTGETVTVTSDGGTSDGDTTDGTDGGTSDGDTTDGTDGGTSDGGGFARLLIGSIGLIGLIIAFYLLSNE